jgi:Ca-activated chloride channel homolog
MTERDLENLKDLPVPAPRETAKRAALEAAMAAFLVGASDTPSRALAGSADEIHSQGNIIPLRQTETSTLKRSFRMYLSSRSSQAIAASVAALVVAAPFAFQHMQSLRDTQPVTISSRIQTELENGSSNAKTSNDELEAKKLLAEKSRLEASGKSDGGRATEDQVAIIDKAAAPKSAEPSPAQSAPAAAQPSVADVRLKPKGEAIVSGRLGRIENGPAISAVPADGKIAGVAPPPAAAAAPKSESNVYTHGLGSTLESNTRFTGQDSAKLNAELGRRMLERDALAPAAADPSKPNPYSWMGRVEQEKAIVLEQNRDKFDAREINPVKQVATEPVSTFSIDVDTASYAFVRRALNAGHLPPKDSVRVEEMINYFPYAYPAPETAETPFKPTVTVMPSPWNANNKLVHVAIKGYDLKSTERPRANIVLLMDVSGSMAPEDRLPLVKNAFRLLVEQLKPDDTVGIVTYASGSGIALEPTKVADKAKILSAIDRLGAGGSTAGAAGISDAYRLAEAGFDKSAVNRIILATDGDFNVGITDQNELKSYIERKRQSGIFLSILGVGQGNHNDALMQTLAQNGNGTAAYADTLNEARKVLVDESSSTLFTIAKDVKLQIEWNPERVAEYRLVGYETRALKREDFNNDKIDAGDIGSGHTVTAIYEVTPVGAQLMSDELRYGKKTTAVAPVPREAANAAPTSGELGFLKLRFKRPNEDTSQLISVPLTDALAKTSVNEVPVEQRFSVAVAAFAQLIKGVPYTQGYTFDDILTLAQSARGDDPFGYRAEFLNLIRLAKTVRE